MGRIPTFDSNSKIGIPGQIEPPSEARPARPEDIFLDPRIMQQAGNALAEGGEQIQKMGEQYAKLATEQELTNAELKLQPRLDKLHQDGLAASAAADKITDIDLAFGTTVNSMTSAVKEEAVNIGDKNARAKFIQSGTKEVFNKRFALSDQMLRDKRDLAQKTLYAGVDQDIKQAADDNYTDISQYEARIKSKFDAMAQVGMIKKVEADKQSKKAIDQLRTYQVDHDISINPKFALDQLNAGADGKYKNIDPKQRLAFTAKAKAADNQKRVIAKNVTEDMRGVASYNLHLKQATNTLKAEEVDTAFVNKQITWNERQNLIKNLTSDLAPVGETDPDTYKKLIDTIHGEDRTPSQDLADIVKANTNGKLSKEDMAKLVNWRIKPMADGFNSLMNLVGPDEGNKKFIEKAIALKDQDQKMSAMEKRNWEHINRNFAQTKDAVEVHQNVIARTQGKTVEEKQSIRDEEINKKRLVDNPEMKSYPPEGHVKVINGVKYRGFSDGRVVREK